jgi:hypothetical protein
MKRLNKNVIIAFIILSAIQFFVAFYVEKIELRMTLGYILGFGSFYIFLKLIKASKK